MGYGHGADAPAPTDWNAINDPGILWINTALLVLASIAMQWTRSAAAHGEMCRTATGLLVAGTLTLGFLMGQVSAWQALDGSGQFTPGNPAAAFFVLLTAVHGLHLIGGLVVWLRTAVRLRAGRLELIDVLRSIELCAVYWHYLLLVWLVLFAVLLAT
jgi:cytochrome c oxidase subunit 3